LKQLAFFCLFLLFLPLGACERKMKEHPLPVGLKKELAQQNDPNAEKTAISGTIAVADAFQAQVPPTATLFLVARPKGAEGGPPLAAKRYSLVKFPFEYRLSSEDVMIPTTPFEGAVDVIARLDQDGNARPQKGDIEGRLTAQVGDAAANIVLDRVIEDAPGGPLSVSGTLRLGPGLEQKLPQGGTLFLFARPRGMKSGPPLAVKRFEAAALPREFSIGQEDTMMPGAVLEGPLTLTARLDQDGNALPAPGDIEGALDIDAGATGVDLVLDHVVGG